MLTWVSQERAYKHVPSFSDGGAGHAPSHQQYSGRYPSYSIPYLFRTLDTAEHATTSSSMCR